MRKTLGMLIVNVIAASMAGAAYEPAPVETPQETAPEIKTQDNSPVLSAVVEKQKDVQEIPEVQAPAIVAETTAPIVTVPAETPEQKAPPATLEQLRAAAEAGAQKIQEAEKEIAGLTQAAEALKAELQEADVALTAANEAAMIAQSNLQMAKASKDAIEQKSAIFDQQLKQGRQKVKKVSDESAKEYAELAKNLNSSDLLAVLVDTSDTQSQQEAQMPIANQQTPMDTAAQQPADGQFQQVMTLPAPIEMVPQMMRHPGPQVTEPVMVEGPMQGQMMMSQQAPAEIMSQNQMSQQPVVMDQMMMGPAQVQMGTAIPA